MLEKRQNSNKMTAMKAFVILVILALFGVNACTSVTLTTIPSPSPTAKLRVFVLAVTESNPPRKIWATSQEEYTKNISRVTAAFLNETGIYEVVPWKEVRAVLGDQTFTDWQWLKNDLALVKQVSKALHADYAIIAMRGYRVHFEFKMVLVNPETDVEYKAGGVVFRQASADWVLKEYRKMVRTCYRQVFYEAKNDLLATAVRKGRLIPKERLKKPAEPQERLALTPPRGVDEKKPPFAQETPQKQVAAISKAQEEIKVPSPPPPEKSTLETPAIPEAIPVSQSPAKEKKPALTKEPLQPKTPAEISMPHVSVFTKPPESSIDKTVPDIKKDAKAPKVIAKTSPVPPDSLPAVDKRVDFEKKLEKELQDDIPATDKHRVVVYDFDTVERLKVVSLILAEALREELFVLGRFTLVNRENMVQVLQELKLQHSGMVDEKQAVELGKWLAANETVTGRLAALGNTYVLQAKRTDIKTLGTLGLGALKCSAGHEDELLSGMPGLVRRLVESKN